MALTESERNNIANYKIQIERYKVDLLRIKELKKDKSEYYARQIKSTKDATTKSNYRQSKIREMNSYDNQIASKKREIEGVKTRIAAIKK
jgi:hypothetical protein